MMQIKSKILFTSKSWCRCKEEYLSSNNSICNFCGLYLSSRCASGYFITMPHNLHIFFCVYEIAHEKNSSF